MSRKSKSREAARVLESREDVANYVTEAIKTGDVAEFALASAIAHRALEDISRSPPARPDRDWYLKDWLELRKISQTRISQLTGWSAGKVNEIYHGEAQYRRETLNVLADILEVEPYEVLLPPAVSQWLRQLIEVAGNRPEGF